MGARLVVTDLDGTLWGASGDIHPAARAALGRLDAAGVPVLAATARRRASVAYAAKQHGIRIGGVLIDGALGYEDLDGPSFHAQSMSHNKVAALVGCLDEWGCEPVFETDDAATQVIAGSRPSMPAEYFEHSPALRCDLNEPFPFAVYSAIVIVDQAVADKVLDAVTSKRLATGWVSRSPAFPDTAMVKLRSPLCSKWSTVALYCERRGIDAGDVVAIGDDDNDVELLREAGTGLAVATASPAAKAVADHIVPAADAGGWASILDFCS